MTAQPNETWQRSYLVRRQHSVPSSTLRPVLRFLSVQQSSAKTQNRTSPEVQGSADSEEVRMGSNLRIFAFWKKCQYENKWMMKQCRAYAQQPVTSSIFKLRERLLYDALQSSRWVNSNICKDPFLFLFNDILVIAKPRPEDSDTFLEVMKPNPADRNEREEPCSRTIPRTPAVQAFVKQFQQTQIMQSHRSSSILQSIHIPERGNHGVTPLDVLLESFTNWWYEANPVHISYDKDLAYRFGRAIVQLNDVLHGAISHEYRQG
ncbi:hypothetical protein EV702DRAFT_1238469 [Suillus placidus]|uniref:SEC7 domain-containing protein n=1 Tax=Suillus placidus TaxID=48579 RepID=A0A9P7D7F0_9AGAM|nr:hypothetical protein EV702DRAFT_1238469 [Suillus placidus]